jgi:hypothetical protein
VAQGDSEGKINNFGGDIVGHDEKVKCKVHPRTGYGGPEWE